MVEMFILLILFFNYIIPYKGIVKLSKSEQSILNAYEHFTLKIDGNKEDLLAMENPCDNKMDTTPSENQTFNTMEILGDINTQKSDDYENMDLSDLLK